MRPLILLALVALVAAQGNNNNPPASSNNPPSQPTSQNQPNTPSSQPTQTNNNNNQPSSNTPNNQPSTSNTPNNTPSSSNNPPSSSNTPNNTPSKGSSSSSGSPPSSSASTQAPKNSVSAPPLTSSSSTSSSSSGSSPTGAVPSALPTIAGAGIPTMIVPNTSKAPFMQKSSLPEGTVFICVGAILGVLGAAVLAWRGATAWSIHRSVKRAAIVSNNPDSKAMLRNNGSGFYGPVPGSTLSLDHLSAAGTKASKHKSAPQNASLFFSPTAGAGMHSTTNRGSGYYPSGYYAAGNAAPAGGNSMAHVGGSPLHQSQNYGTQRSRSFIRDSPPPSPGLPPGSRDGYARPGSSGPFANPSQSSLNLNATPQVRAPSAYLEDLFENHGNGPRERF